MYDGYAFFEQNHAKRYSLVYLVYKTLGRGDLFSYVYTMNENKYIDDSKVCYLCLFYFNVEIGGLVGAIDCSRRSF